MRNIFSINPLKFNLMKVFSLIVILLLLLLVGSSFSVSESSTSKPSKCTFVLVNETWDTGIMVWVKAGNQSNSDERPNYGNPVLVSKGNSLRVSVDTDISWRREADPSRRTNPTTWQPVWNNETCFVTGGTKTVVIR